MHRHKSSRTELVASNLLAGALSELLLEATQPEGAYGRMPQYVHLAMEEIEREYARKLSLDDLAVKASVSKYHLARAVKRHVGVTPGEYMIGVRLDRAKELLKHSGLPVASVAAAVGIDNASHFIRLFKGRDGHTPLVFRRSWQRPR